MQIFCRTLTGSTVALDVERAATVRAAKELIAQVVGVPADVQMLSWSGRMLDDHRTLESYGIDKESTLHLMVQARGD
jgi:hypothetical protein